MLHSATRAVRLIQELLKWSRFIQLFEHFRERLPRQAAKDAKSLVGVKKQLTSSIDVLSIVPALISHIECRDRLGVRPLR